MTKIPYRLTTPDGTATVTRSATREYDYAAFRVLELEDGTITTDAPGTDLCASFGNSPLATYIKKLRTEQPYKMVRAGQPRAPRVRRVISLHVIPTQFGAAKGLKGWHETL